MRIAVDIDNCVLDWQGGWIAEYVSWFDLPLGPTARCDWSGFLTGTHFETARDFWEWMDFASVWRDLPPIKGAFGALYRMRKAGHDIVFCTAREGLSARTAAERLASWHSVDIEFRAPDEKHLTEADIWIDDSPEVLENLAFHDRRAIRFVRPWNLPLPGVVSAFNWRQVLDHVDFLASVVQAS